MIALVIFGLTTTLRANCIAKTDQQQTNAG